MAKNKKADNQVSAVRRAKHGWVLTVFFSILAVLWLYPIFLVAMNSLKKKGFITRYPFALPDHRSFFGIENFIKGVQKTNFFAAMGNSVIITVGSVAVIILCTSMCAWYITRVHNKVNSTIYMLCLFSMIVPFQMVMFSLSKLANMMHLSNPIGIILVYLGFGAGLAVFMFCGFVKSIPLEIEEAAMIDGCTPLQTFFQVVFPIMKPTTITVAILQELGVQKECVKCVPFTFSFKPQQDHYTRADLTLPEEKFLVATVGWRLDDEVTGAYLKMLEEAVGEEPAIHVVFVGRFHRFGEALAGYPVLQAHATNLGEQQDVLAVLECMDLYVNPARSGGGSSAAEALSKGLPVVTLPVGDVAVAAGEIFEVEDYPAMQRQILRYAADHRLYAEMTQKARARAELLLDSKAGFGQALMEIEQQLES